MAMTDPDLVFLLLDTGHAHYAGEDPLEIVLIVPPAISIFFLLINFRQSSMQLADNLQWPLIVVSMMGSNGKWVFPSNGTAVEYNECRKILYHDTSIYVTVENEDDSNSTIQDILRII